MKVFTKEHHHGAKARYTLTGGVEYTISFDVDKRKFDPKILFMIKKDGKRMYSQIINQDKENVSFVFTPQDTGKYVFSFRLNDRNYTGEDQFFFVDNISITQDEIPTLTIREEKNYYPFGLQHKGYNSTISGRKHQYGFANKELEEDLGKNTVAYEWRDYDPTIARFNKIDRFSEKYYAINPYNYAANNPIFFKDIKGDSIQGVSRKSARRARRIIRSLGYDSVDLQSVLRMSKR